MSDDDLIAYVTEFREGILGGKSSDYYCAMICWPLAPLLCLSGIDCSVVESDLDTMNHVWIKLPDGRALDPTMDQFNRMFADNWPPVYLGKPTKYHVERRVLNSPQA